MLSFCVADKVAAFSAVCKSRSEKNMYRIAFFIRRGEFGDFVIIKRMMRDFRAIRPKDGLHPPQSGLYFDGSKGISTSADRGKTMEKLLIGLDFGSDSVRSVLVTENGEQLATCVHNYARWAEGRYCDAANNRFRQHPLDYLEGVEAVIKGALKGQDASRVAGIAIDTTGSTPCAVDRDGTPLALKPEFADNPNAMFILWKDHTAIAEAARINEYAASWGGTDFRIYEGGIYSSEWFWSKILHTLKADPEVRAAAYSWVEHCDWITGELAGRTEPLTMVRSRCAAGHKAMWHASWGGLPSEEFLAGVDPLLAGLRDRLYTETCTADVPVGTLSPKWAAKLGLSTDVVIGGSAFDCHFGAVGAQIQPYELVKVIGTSTCDILVAPEIPQCVKGICGQVDGSVVPGLVGLEAGQSAFGDVYARDRRTLSFGRGSGQRGRCDRRDQPQILFRDAALRGCVQPADQGGGGGSGVRARRGDVRGGRGEGASGPRRGDGEDGFRLRQGVRTRSGGGPRLRKTISALSRFREIAGAGDDAPCMRSSRQSVIRPTSNFRSSGW